MLAKALLLSALSGGGPGAQDLSQSVAAPVAPAPVSPSAGAGSPLFQALVASNASPKDDIPEPNPKKAKDFVEGMDKRPDYIKNLLSGLGVSK